MRRSPWIWVGCAASSLALPVYAGSETNLGYPEPVVHWLVETGETCRDIALALYDSDRYEALVHRYNDVDCSAPITPDRLLVLPLEVRAVPVARLTDSKPVVRARPPDGVWAVANTGMTFDEGYGVNTLQRASADLLFRDNSRILLQENTLVVIYDGATKSVSRASSGGSQLTVDEGELRAAISSLQGPPVTVVTDGGGAVQVRSSETTVARRAGRIAVSVFEGEARVTSAATTVTVPKEHGTTYHDAAPPWLPRPLPGAPSWERAGRTVAVESSGSTESLAVSWSVVNDAVAYRVEVAHDAAFRRVVLREEVPRRVRSLQLSGIPLGRYFVRVQAVDPDGLLGIPSPAQPLWMVGFRGEVLRGPGAVLIRNVYEPLQVVPSHDYRVLVRNVSDAGVRPDETAAIDVPEDAEFLLWTSATGDEQTLRVVAERPNVDLVGHWLDTEKPVLRLRAALHGRLWQSGQVPYGGLSSQHWERAAFRWTVRQGTLVGDVTPAFHDGTAWVADVPLERDLPVEVEWTDAGGVRLSLIHVPRRVTGGKPPASPAWAPLALTLPGTVLPMLGVGVPTATSVGLRSHFESRAEDVFVNASASLGSVWSVAAEWQASVGSGITSSDQGSVSAYAALSLGRSWHLGIRNGVRLPFSLGGPRVSASTGLGVQGDFGAWSVMSGADVRVPLASNGVDRSAASCQFGVLWRASVLPIRAFALAEGLAALERGPQQVFGAGYLGVLVGSRWTAGVTARAGGSPDVGSQLSLQSSLQHRF